VHRINLVIKFFLHQVFDILVVSLLHAVDLSKWKCECEDHRAIKGWQPVFSMENDSFDPDKDMSSSKAIVQRISYLKNKVDIGLQNEDH